jgi:glucose-6-phosphate 1-dehydrogenase
MENFDIHKIHTPTVLVLLGATGDLAQKKLLSSLFSLYRKNSLPENFHLIAVSKDEYSQEEYRAFAKKHILKKHNDFEKGIDLFLRDTFYIQGFFNEDALFSKIKDALTSYDEKIKMCSSKLFYIATHPRLYETVFTQIAQVNLEKECSIGNGWTRILVEKPFGNDLKNAQYLDKKLSILFKEEQIYRIDHYLAKNALQNILSFRFSNIFFENRWNRNYIESIIIRAHESFGVEKRGAFFDGVGALRDVGQNHILQMLALIGMEYPEDFSASSIREERAKVLEKLRFPHRKNYGKTIIKGQYDGYKDIPDVKKESKTETYFALKAFIDNKRWKGVPFYLEHGKGVSENVVDITVQFRPSRHCVCATLKEKEKYKNTIKFTISPCEEITVRFWARNPAFKYTLEPRDFVFLKDDKKQNQDKKARDGYEAVLFDALSGDQTLFVSSREQNAQWSFVTHILEMWENDIPFSYKKGDTSPLTPLSKEIHTLLLT